MATMLGLRMGVPFNKSIQGLPSTLLVKFEYLWTGKFSGDDLLSDLGPEVITVTGKDFITSYIPDTTTATFAVPDNATFLADDGADDFWFSALNVLQQKIFTELIESTTLRTFIKYTDFEPYSISIIGILKDGEVLTEADKVILNKYFKLWVQYWGETMMESGYMKDNRTFIDDPLTDWYLPSRDELAAMKTQLYDEGVGNMLAYGYWSSSEFNALQADSYQAPMGSLVYANYEKESVLNIRACRSFIDTSGTYSLRDSGPSGGWIFHITDNLNGTSTYYEAAPTDIAEAAWSNITNAAIGTTGTAIGTGQANTTAIINQVGHTASAAKSCDDSVI